MFETTIKLNTINDVYDFTMSIQQIPCEIDLTTELRRYTVDAKSIMGVFSLDLSKQLKVLVHSDNDDVINEVLACIRKTEEDSAKGKTAV